MLDLTVIDNALKDIYQNITRDQINLKLAAVAQKINSTTKDIEGGRKVVKPVPFGLNGGTGSGTETGALPASGGNKYEKFESTLKNLYGTIELSDKVIESTKSNAASFVSALSSEIKGLEKSCIFSSGRQYYMDGTGVLSVCKVNTAATTLEVNSVQYVTAGMTIDIRTAAGALVTNGSARRVLSVTRASNTIVLDGSAVITTEATDIICEQISFGNEITGFGAVFKSTGTLYGIDKAKYDWMTPQLFAAVGTIEDEKISKAIQQAEDWYGSNIDYMACAPDVQREYASYLTTMKQIVNSSTLSGGFKAIDFQGIPLVRDRFILSGELFGLDSSQWALHQLDDWSWMDDRGVILKQKPGYAVYAATIRKYCELICDSPAAQLKLSGITVG